MLILLKMEKLFEKWVKVNPLVNKLYIIILLDLAQYKHIQNAFV